MRKGGKSKGDTGRGKRKAVPARDPSPVQDTPSETEAEVESIPEDMPEDSQEEFGNARKKQRLHVKLTDDQEDQLVGLIQENTNLYDKANKQWLNKDVRNQTWQEIAMKIGLPADHLMHWFHSMRTRLGRLKKTKSGQGALKVTERDRWIIRVFDFLCPHIVQVSRRNAVSLKDKIAASRPDETLNIQPPIEASLDDDLDADCPGQMPDLNDPVSGPSSQPRPVSPPTHPTLPTPRTIRKKAPVVTAAAQDDLLLKIHDQSIRTTDLLQQSNEIMRTLRPSGVNERISFAQWFTNVLVQLPESVYDSLVDDVFARTKAAKIEARRPQQQSQFQVQQQQPLAQQSHVQQPDSGWQPPPNQWNPQPTPGVSVWNSMNTEYVQRHYPGYRPASCPPDTSPPLFHNLQTPTASRDPSFSDSFLSSLGLPRPVPAATATATATDPDDQPVKDTSE